MTPEKCLSLFLSEMERRYIPIWSRWGIRVEKVFVRATNALFVIKYKDILLTPIRAIATTFPSGAAPLRECGLRLYTAYLEDEIFYLSDDPPRYNPGLWQLTTNLVINIVFWTAALDLHIPAIYGYGRGEDKYGWEEVGGDCEPLSAKADSFLQARRRREVGAPAGSLRAQLAGRLSKPAR